MAVVVTAVVVTAVAVMAGVSEVEGNVVVLAMAVVTAVVAQ